ncbi:TonB-dependent receptor domain-containing protein [Winogradskyella bathintestinalis]|uniref:TonB-dependent receptor n=1 Tax=Winogradskyella bathintestinalis TaxID=3035208 RepID=A0ABT7ZU12_9FLAO|nr:TonB-dependent receptor [Winogradskyella bathintestinalis]MDN3492495.1 TonB-dependent receptor [Winogradskyella bathintestinalis]
MKEIQFKIMAIIFLIAIINPLHAQNISGRVTDYSDATIPDVSIFINNEIIAETNADGIFTLSETYQLPIELILKHPDYYIKTVIFSKNNSTIKLLELENTQNLEEVIISSTYQKESQIIIPTAKVTSEKIETYSPVDLVSAINETPGIYIQSGAINTNRIVIRGVGSRTLYGTNKIRAYFNGIPITNGTGDTAIDAFDPEDIENLEIVKGPKATQYGTNLGGTLLLNSKQALKGETYFKTNLTVGSYGLIKNNVSFATATDKLALNLNYDYLETDGFRDNNSYTRHAVFLTANYRFDKKNELGVLMNYTDYFAQIPSSISKTAFEEDPSQAAFTWNAAEGYEDNQQILAGLNYTHRFSDHFSNTTTFFYTYLDHYEPRPFNILDEYTNGYGARTLFAKDFNFLNNKANLSFGGEIYKDQYNWKTIENLYDENNGNGSLEGQTLSDNIENRNNFNVFATATLPFTTKIKAQFGINVNTTNYSFTDDFNVGEANLNADRDFDPIFAPNVNLLYQFTPHANVYANFSRGFNYPSIEETLTPEGVINPDLGPETGFNYEIGSEVSLLKGRLQIHISAYLLDIDNLLVAERVGDDQYIGRNAGKTEHKGIELALSYTQSFNNNFLITPYLNAELSDNKFIDFVDDENDFSGNELTGVPSRKVNGGIQFGFKNFTLNTNFLHIGEMPMNDANTLYSDEYTVFSTKLSYNNNLSKHLSMEINAGINNFTNEAYDSSILINAVGFGNSEPRYYYPGMPRNWFSSFKIAYSI